MSKRQLDSHRVHLRDYQGNDIPVVGVGRFRIAFKDFSGLLRLVVVEGQRPSLLGLDWFDALGLEVTGINCISNAETEGLVKDFAEVFDGTLGQYTGTPISFSLDPQVAPIKLKPRRIPFALKAKVDEQLDKLIAQGVLEPVDHAKWETPIVTPVKPDGSVRSALTTSAQSTRHFSSTLIRFLLSNTCCIPWVRVRSSLSWTLPKPINNCQSMMPLLKPRRSSPTGGHSVAAGCSSG